MKKSILILSIFFFALQLSAQEPQVKFYLNDGTYKSYNISDVDNIGLIKTPNSMLMRVYYQKKLTDNYQTSNIDSLKIMLNKTISNLRIYFNKYKFKTYRTTDIDSINYLPIIDGYASVKIGTQEWMINNLNVDHYRNDDSIPEVRDSETWSKLTTGAWCYYDNNPANGMIYGKLYNWYALNDPRGLAPKGWHMPSDDDWTILETYIGGREVASGKLKEAGTSHWYSPDEDATNEWGFTALPGGFRENSADSSFCNLGFSGNWWTSTRRDTNYVEIRTIYNSSCTVWMAEPKSAGLSIRCIRNNSSNNPNISFINPTSAKINEAITISGYGFDSTQGSSFISFNGTKAIVFISWSDTVIKVEVPAGVTTGALSVTVNGTKSNEVDFNIKSTYPIYFDTVTIGTQVWMKKNLDVDLYRNGDPIPQVTDPTEWENLTTGAWCYYSNDAKNGTTYGKLYNWYAVNDPRGLAPTGWHVPSDAEWTTLSTYLGGVTEAGGKLKEAGTAHWNFPNSNATNESGFTALAGGYRHDNGPYHSIFEGAGLAGGWWSSTENLTTSAWSRGMGYTDPYINRYNNNKWNGYSIRCVRE